MTPHSHDPQEQSVDVAKLRASLKERAAGSRGTLTQLMSDHTTDVPVDVHAALGNPDTVKRSLRPSTCPRTQRRSVNARWGVDHHC